VSPRARLGALVGVLLLVVTTLVPGLAPAGAQEDGEVAPTMPATPILSARRLPGVLQGVTADPALAGTLDPYLDRAAGDACAVVLDRGRVVYRRNFDVSMVPASVLKLLTGTAALEVLGTDRRLATVAGADAPMAAGVVEGDLFVVGGGDPLLTTPGFKASLDNPAQLTEAYSDLADALVAAGLTEVRGDVVGDDSRYEDVRWLPTWPDRYQAEGDVGPISALIVNDGQTGFTETPDEETADRRPGDPPLLAAQTLKTLLEQRGVRIGGEGSTGVAPEGFQEIARMESVPMAEIVGEMITDSDNTTAEMLTREMGVVAKGEGTTAAGLQVIRETLGSLGYDTTGLALNDGSGMDPANQVPCPLVLELISRSGPDTLIGGFLPLAGETGTLHERMLESEATGRVRAKTGTLNQVNALAGFADTPPGSSITFVMIQNGSQPNGKAWVDDYADLLMSYAAAPGLDVLGPLPPVS
jgi:D-alanyl-D-alanine carboxypeptidase/D-alanyl-D-alanine-endopeptidase (penicillin-binding protein 4)